MAPSLSLVLLPSYFFPRHRHDTRCEGHRRLSLPKPTGPRGAGRSVLKANRDKPGQHGSPPLHGGRPSTGRAGPRGVLGRG